MISNNEAAIESEIEAKGLNAPRRTRYEQLLEFLE